jgi:hypothetical protein
VVYVVAAAAAAVDVVAVAALLRQLLCGVMLFSRLQMPDNITSEIMR